jgi:hypothetical protein
VYIDLDPGQPELTPAVSWVCRFAAILQHDACFVCTRIRPARFDKQMQGGPAVECSIIVLQGHCKLLLVVTLLALASGTA